jgi:hypothetical protein
MHYVTCAITHDDGSFILSGSTSLIPMKQITNNELDINCETPIKYIISNKANITTGKAASSDFSCVHQGNIVTISMPLF